MEQVIAMLVVKQQRQTIETSWAALQERCFQNRISIIDRQWQCDRR